MATVEVDLDGLTKQTGLAYWQNLDIPSEKKARQHKNAKKF